MTFKSGQDSRRQWFPHSLTASSIRLYTISPFPPLTDTIPRTTGHRPTAPHATPLRPTPSRATPPRPPLVIIRRHLPPAAPPQTAQYMAPASLFDILFFPRASVQCPIRTLSNASPRQLPHDLAELVGGEPSAKPPEELGARGEVAGRGGRRGPLGIEAAGAGGSAGQWRAPAFSGSLWQHHVSAQARRACARRARQRRRRRRS